MPSRVSGTIMVVVRELALARVSASIRPRSDSVRAASVAAILAPSVPAISAVPASSLTSGTPMSSPRATRCSQGGSRALSTPPDRTNGQIRGCPDAPGPAAAADPLPAGPCPGQPPLAARRRRGSRDRRDHHHGRRIRRRSRAAGRRGERKAVGMDLADPRLTGRRARRRLGDRGSSVIAAAIAFTVILPLLSACFQAALWFAARDAALSAARQGADAAAQGGTLGGGLAAACQYARTAAAGILRGPACTGSTGNTIAITVTGSAPAIVPLFPAQVTEQAQAPRERFTTRTSP